jgi:hypothetical protein
MLVTLRYSSAVVMPSNTWQFQEFAHTVLARVRMSDVARSVLVMIPVHAQQRRRDTHKVGRIGQSEWRIESGVHSADLPRITIDLTGAPDSVSEALERLP